LIEDLCGDAYDSDCGEAPIPSLTDAGARSGLELVLAPCGLLRVHLIRPQNHREGKMRSGNGQLDLELGLGCTSQETHYVSATEPNRLMLFGETVAVYC
jgi:hypothetical protein